MMEKLDIKQIEFPYMAENSVKSAGATRPNRPLVVKWRVGLRLGGVLSDRDVRRAARCRYHPITTRAGGWRSDKTPD